MKSNILIPPNSGELIKYRYNEREDMNFEKHLEEQLKDEEFKKEWEDLQSEYSIIDSLIKSSEMAVMCIKNRLEAYCIQIERWSQSSRSRNVSYYFFVEKKQILLI